MTIGYQSPAASSSPYMPVIFGVVKFDSSHRHTLSSPDNRLLLVGGINLVRI